MAELRVKGTGTLKLFESDNTSSVTIASPASLSANKTITLPDADVTLASGTMLATDGSGASLTSLNASELGSGTVPTARLGTGTASSSTVLYGDNTWAAAGGNNTPNFWVYNSTAQTISTATHTAIAFDTAVIDTASGLGSYRWTVPAGQGGTYFLTFRQIYSGTWDARIIAFIYNNGAQVMGMQADKERADGGVHVNGIITLSAGDYIEGYVYQSSGSDQDVVAGSLWNSLSGFKLL
jgi:hypothetical protein